MRVGRIFKNNLRTILHPRIIKYMVIVIFSSGIFGSSITNYNALYK